MQFFPILFIAAALLFTCSCSHKSYPISTKARIDPQVPRVAKPTRVVITAKNNTPQEIMVPPYVKIGDEWVMDSAGVSFSRERRPRFPVGNSIDICPPQRDTIPAKSSREYTFYWTPKAFNVGDGFLHIGVPSNFHPLKSIPIRVED